MLGSELNRMQEEWKLRETRILETLRLEKIEFEHRLQFVTGILTEVKRMLKDPSRTPDPKNMELCFSNKISQPILTGDEIKGEDNKCIQVVLRDSSTRNIVDIGPVASASVGIVVLGQGTDDWTGEEFNEKILRVEGKPPLLTVDVCELQGGVGVLENVKFRHHATDVKPSEFRLGARIAEKFDGIIVKEAKTESFVVKSYRSKYSRKNEIPNLSDEIWVLKNIQKRGEIDKRLRAKEINTVEKFLKQLLINHQELKNIARLGKEKWEATVNHARKCKSDKMYCYMNSQKNTCVVFDIFGKLQGLYSEGQYAASNMLSENKKVDADKLLSSAFGDWENVTDFDGPNSCQLQVAARTSSYLSNPSCSSCPGINSDTGASKMANEFNNIKFQNSSFNQESLIPNTALFAHCGSFGIHDLCIDNSHLALDQLADLDLDTMFSDFDIGYEVHGARIDGTGSVSAEPEIDVRPRGSRKRSFSGCQDGS